MTQETYNEEQLVATLNDLNQQVNQLNIVRGRLMGELERIHAEADKIKAYFMEKYQTNDLETLKTIIKEQMQANIETVALHKKNVESYRQELEQLELEIKKVR